MISKFIQVSAVACALALAGTAVANNNGGSQQQSTQQQSQTQQPQTQQPQMQQGQQQQATQQSGVKSVRLAALNQDQIKEVQTRLKDCGFYRGSVDGVLGNATKSALTAFFQNQVTLAQQGRLSDEAMTGFGFGANDIERVRGVDNGQTNQGQTQQAPAPQNQNSGNQNNNNNNNVNNDRQNTRGQ